MSGTVLFVGSRIDAHAAARALGLRVLLLRFDTEDAPSPRGVVRQAYCDPAGDATAAALALCAGERLVGVVALTEHAVEPAAAVRAALGLRGLSPDVARRAHDKVAMKEAIRAAGLPCTDWAALDEASDAAALVRRLGLPLVVKPRRSSGGRGLTFAVDEREARAAIAPDRIAERYLTGVEMSVESFVAGGEILLRNPTEYLVVGHANVLPAALPPATAEAVDELNRRAIAALGIERGIVHVELFLTGRGPVFGEAAVRPPGGRIMRALRTAYRFDVWRALLEIELGGRPALPRRARRTAGVWMLHPGEGTVRSVTGAEEARAVPGVTRLVCRVGAGARIARRLGTGQDVGFIEARGKSRDAVAAALREAWGRLRFDLG